MERIIKASVESIDAQMLLNELDSCLESITGDNGKGSFCTYDFTASGGTFLICYNDLKPVACGAIRKYTDKVAEMKRVYARKNGFGAAHKIVKALEEKALEQGFDSIILETRKVNLHAVSFYKDCGYIQCENFGKYKGRDNAVCFQKKIRK